MESIKQRIKNFCEKRQTTVSNILMTAGIQSGDYYLAVNGKKPFYRGWRKRISEALDIEESELFPEFQDAKEV